MCSSSSHFQQSSLQMFWFFKNLRGYSSLEILSNLFQLERWWRLHQLWSPYNLRCNQSLLLQKQIEKKQYSDYCLLTMQDRAMNKQLHSVLISRIIVSLPEISDVRNCFWSSVLNELIKVEIKFKMHLYIQVMLQCFRKFILFVWHYDYIVTLFKGNSCRLFEFLLAAILLQVVCDASFFVCIF